MKLFLTKNQSKGLLGGVKFEVTGEVELTDVERELIRRYNLDTEVLLAKPLNNLFGEPTDVTMDITIRDLLRGETYRCKDLSEVIAYSENLVEACDNLKTYLEVASNFGGQEIIDI